MVSEVGQIQFREDVLHGDESVGVLLDDIGLCLPDILPYVQVWIAL